MVDLKKLVFTSVLLLSLLTLCIFLALSRSELTFMGCKFSINSPVSGSPRDDVVGIFAAAPSRSKTREKLTLIHITKTGSSALEDWGRLHGFDWSIDLHGHLREQLAQHEDNFDLQNGSTVPVPPWHSPPRYIQRNPYKTHDSVAVVRDPFARMISEFRCPWNGFQAPRQFGSSQDEYDAKLKIRAAATADDLNEWVVEKLEHSAARPPFANGHMVPQHLYIVGSRGEWWVRPENVLRMENLTEGFAALRSRYKIVGGPLEYIDESEMKGFSVDDLSEKARALIEQEYRLDFEYFGYRKPCPWDSKIKCMECPELPRLNYSDSRSKPSKPCEKRGNAAHRYIFVLAVAFTGSSPMAGLFMTIPKSSPVTNLCAAQSWQCEGLKVLENLGWEETTPQQKFTADFNWTKVFETYENIWDMTRYYLLEKSFENIYHIERLLEYVRASKRTALWVVMTRSPCTMKTFGQYPNEVSRNDGRLLHADRFLRSQGEEVMHIRYEDLVLRPYEVAQRLVMAEPCLHGIDPGTKPEDMFRSYTEDVGSLRCKLASRFAKSGDNGGELGKWVRTCAKTSSRRAGRRLVEGTPFSIVDYSKSHGLSNHLEMVPSNYSEFLNYFGYYDVVK